MPNLSTWLAAPLPGLLWVTAALVVRAAMPPPIDAPPRTLPAAAVQRLIDGLERTARASAHPWRELPPINGDGTVNVYIEIARGDHRKWELDLARGTRIVDRVLPETLGGFPVNYGIVPQTISYDGDPFDALVLGPPIDGGTMVRGAIVGVMHMTDEKGLDSKVVLAVPGAGGRPAAALDEGERARIGAFFAAYKKHERDRFSTMEGWGPASAGRAFVETTHAFFRECRREPAAECKLRAP